MVQSAEYIHSKLVGEGLLELAYSRPGTAGYPLVCTGHSLGAGTAAILAVLLRDSGAHPDTQCYAFSPPGGLLSEQAMLASQVNRKNAQHIAESWRCTTFYGFSDHDF